MITRRQRRLGLTLLLLNCAGLAAAPAQPAPPAAAAPATAENAELVLLRVPPPQLDGLEAAVRSQLEDAAARLTRLPGPARAGNEVSRDELAERFGELGHLYHAYELWPSAEAAYENARRLEKDEPSWTWSLAVVAFKKGEIAKARQLFGEVLELAPEHPAAQLYLAEIALQEGRAEEAGELAAAVLKKIDASPAALFAAGRAALLADRPQEAIPALELALEQVPDANRLHYLLAMARRATGDLDNAKKEMALAGQVGIKIPDPLDPVLAAYRRGERVATVEGDLAMNAGRFAEAVAAYEKATAAQPQNAELWTRLAAARATGGDLAGGERDLRHALELDPFLPVALLQLGRVLAFEKKFADAIPFFERLLDLDKDNAAGHRELGLALNALGRRQQALEHLRPVLTVLPADEDARLGAATAAVELGLYQEARDLLVAGLELDPSQGRLARALARILAAVPQLELRDGVRALQLAEQVYRATQSPLDEEILGLALAEAGRCDEAAALFDRLAAAAGDPARTAALAARAASCRQGPPCRPPGVNATAAPAPPRQP